MAVNYFSTHEWSFQRNNVTNMVGKVKTLENNNIVDLDLEEIDWKKYFEIYFVETKKFFMKEDPKSTNAARQWLLLYV
jgi:hypothetical protein